MLAIRLPESIEQRLNALAEETGRTKTTLAREAILEFIDDLEDYYLAYQKTARVPGEFVASIRVPHRTEGQLLRAYKISKRFDQDISAVFACIALTLREGKVAAVRIGCGGVAPVPTHAAATEAALAGREWNEATAEAAVRKLAGEFSPIADMRASADYRRKVLGNLMRRFWLETSETAIATRVDGLQMASTE